MRILITGYRGFIGQNMVRALANEHDLQLYEWGESVPTVKNLDWVIHLGAISSTTERDVERIMVQNYDFSCWLLDQCSLNGVNFQYASSASVYGLGREFSEYSKPDPRGPYSWSKFLFDRHVSRIYPHLLKDCVVQGFRYFNVHGPYEDHKGEQASPYHKFEQQAKTTGKIKVFYGSHHYLRDFIHVNRVVDIHKKFFHIKESGIWNVGSGQPTSFQAIADQIAKKYNATIEYIDMPENVKSQYQTYTCADLTKLTRTLNE